MECQRAVPLVIIIINNNKSNNKNSINNSHKQFTLLTVPVEPKVGCATAGASDEVYGAGQQRFLVDFWGSL